MMLFLDGDEAGDSDEYCDDDDDCGCGCGDDGADCEDADGAGAAAGAEPTRAIFSISRGLPP
ncbi:MAG: hypothetical protein V4578_22460, partial [Pseudomonadota bacterium]